MKREILGKCPFCGKLVYTAQRHGMYTFIPLQNGRHAHRHCYEKYVKSSKRGIKRREKIEEIKRTAIGWDKGPVIRREKEEKYRYTS